MLKNVEVGTTSGVYLFKNKSRKIIYIGKAINLASRLKSYFQGNAPFRQQRIVKEATQVETIEVDSEIEALILEANLIKKFQPIYNIQLKDDKDYLYIKFVKEPFPRVVLARKKDLADAKEYFGPYPSARSVRSTLRSLRKIFPYRTCSLGQKRACFYFHIGLCPGVCAGAITEKDYLKNIAKLRLFLQGGKIKVVTLFEREMKTEAAALNFEKAEELKSKIEAINYIIRPVRRVDEYLEASAIEEIRQRELADLTKILHLKIDLERIECFDVSNFSGKSATGSMVVFSAGTADKAQYRRFKIKGHDSLNDPAMMGEVLRRRLKNPWPLPKLIVVDGGKTQIAAVSKELIGTNIRVPVIGLAKRNEDIYTQKGERIRLPKDSEALFLLQRIRDEAHRFAISYYRKLASQNLLTPA
ncbi:MAG: hypothetical protein A3F35_02070 [Candidatus Woykebacteria bacterium RIFCSPHIGHO2_12_FULL_45_10]|uniref:Excinuclease ABC subunit C n=1 Tax=Candidatus Woykebacteria bacterium RIFCSPHIGHO2_12_FULL_45_10 TaxID=1802603 RepID=A0A1G1WN11_9BACT|nr:MAG: hypothetical protein A3F35_02070 [Candidatus Woykebacteria bacterium RIFCSPHIGHO2_12_FULL_45_10]